ncbi:RNA polymerase sigma factor (sigma-70 family) [Nocardioides daedukensis]|uniref:RNA polymerase sigma factor (Sigma-70 family) n=1 Tax=Nocardioides daedukensis TaxID=634462 RepID=A0A7Y9UW46_9ACTN|nr:RNA polymerase sigma factor (sigma-70 family) [Nocardioides daedukensis]
MTTTLAEIDGPGDAELISAVRGGDLSAYGDLFERHVDAARRLARQLTNHSDADDLVSDAFAKVLKVLQDGRGPDLAFRAYLLTAVRRLHIDRIRSTSKLHTTGDLEPFDPGVPFRDTAVEGFENAAAAKAFASLPERWQLVLWHTEVEGHKPAEVATLLGMSANSVSALAYRAREGLRQAFLNSHAVELEDAQCRWTHEHLGGYVRNGLSKRDAGKVEKHLDECRPCMAIYLELTEVNSNLGALLAPLLLGSVAGTTYLAGAGGTLAAKGGLLLLFGRAKDLVLANTQAAAVGSVAAVTAVAGVSVVAITTGDDSPQTAGSPPAGIVRSAEPAPAKTAEQVTGQATDPVPTAPSSPSPNPLSEAPVPAPLLAPPMGTTPTDSPSTDPTLDAPGPTEPTSDPTSTDPTPTAPADPSPAPTDTPPEPEPSPTAPTEPPVTHDLKLSIAKTRHTFGTRLDITTSGYPPNGHATITIDSNLLAFGRISKKCDRVGLTTKFTCPVTAADPAVRIDLVLEVFTSVRASVVADNFTDADTSNNSASWKSALLP